MKKIIGILAVTCFIIVSGCAPEINASSSPADITAPTDPTLTTSSVTPPPQQAAAAVTYIGEEAAKAAALEHAGLTETELTFVRVHLDHDDGRTVYDIEFYQGNSEYDYEIDAVTGTPLSYDYDIDNYNVLPEQSSDPVPAPGEISLDEAKAIALAKANLTADQVTYTESSYEYDDGIAVYQIDFWAGNLEYEFEIKASDGTIREYDADMD